MITWLRSFIPKSEAAKEVEALRHEKMMLEIELMMNRKEVEMETANVMEVVGPSKKVREEIQKGYESGLGELLDVWLEKSKQGAALDAAQSVMSSQLMAVDEAINARHETYAGKSKWLHGYSVIFSSMADKCNAGVPFAAESYALSRYPSDNTLQQVYASLKKVSTNGVSTLDHLKSSFCFGSADHSTMNTLEEVEGHLQRSEVFAALKKSEGISNIEGLAAWKAQAKDYITAQQGVHYIGSNMVLHRFSV